MAKSKSQPIRQLTADLDADGIYRLQLIQALNRTNTDLDSTAKKDIALQYMKANGYPAKGYGNVPELDYRMIGTLAHIHTQVMELQEVHVARLHKMISDFVRDHSRVEPEVTPSAQEVPTAKLSIRDKMSVKADKLMVEIDQYIDDLFAGAQSNFDISKWIAVNAVPGMMCKVIAEKLSTVITDMRMLKDKDPDTVEAYSHIPASRQKLIHNVLSHVVNVLTSHKTEKKFKAPTKRQKAKQATAKFSRAVLRSKAFEWMKEGKNNKQLVDIFVKQMDVKEQTAKAYAYAFRKEFDALSEGNQNGTNPIYPAAADKDEGVSTNLQSPKSPKTTAKRTTTKRTKSK